MKILLVMSILISAVAFAEIASDVQATVEVVSASDKEVLIKQEDGTTVSLPRSAVKNKKIVPGKDSLLILTAKDYQSLRAKSALQKQ